MTATNLQCCIERTYKEKVIVSTSPGDIFTLVGPFEQVTAIEDFILKRQHSDPSIGNRHDRNSGKYHQGDTERAEDFTMDQPTSRGGISEV